MTSVLLLVDVQRNMLQPPEPVPDASAVAGAIEEVLDRARAAGAIVVHVRNNGEPGDPDVPGAPGWELVHEVLEGEHVIDKFEANAFAGTDLGDLVPDDADVVVVGMQSNYCVRATTLAALERGNPATLVTGAHATYDEDLPAAEISAAIEKELAAAGASVAGVGGVAFG